MSYIQKDNNSQDETELDESHHLLSVQIQDISRGSNLSLGNEIQFRYRGKVKTEGPRLQRRKGNYFRYIVGLEGSTPGRTLTVVRSRVRPHVSL